MKPEDIKVGDELYWMYGSKIVKSKVWQIYPGGNEWIELTNTEIFMRSPIGGYDQVIHVKHLFKTSDDLINNLKDSIKDL